MPSQRTAHQRHPAQGKKYPSVQHGAGAGQDEGTDGFGQGYLPDKATQEDLNYKAAYGIARLRSPYLSIVQMPTEVRPGDHAEARAITLRIQKAIDIQGRWTRSERVRLYRLRETWNRRAGGSDVYFNLRGWKQLQEKRTGRGEVKDETDARKFASLVEGVREIIGE